VYLKHLRTEDVKNPAKLNVLIKIIAVAIAITMTKTLTFELAQT